jgi:uncharacterized membrane protein
MFEFLFKYPPAVFSRGKFVLLSGLPLWLFALGVIGTSAALGWMAWRKRGWHAFGGVRLAIVWLLESALAALVLLLLWHPAMSVTALRPQQNIVAVVVDDSKSMSVKDSGSPRIETAKQVLDRDVLRDLSSRFQVRLYRLGAGLTRIENSSELSGSEPATHIGGALKQLADEAAAMPIGAVVLLSDGSDNTGGVDFATLTALRRQRLPVSTIGFGRERIDNDIELGGIELTSRTLANSRLEAQVSIQQNGFNGKKVRLTICSAGSTVASRDIVLHGGRQTENIEFNAGPAGAKEIEAQIDPLPGEENRANNRLTRILQVDGGARRILYAEGEPRWEFKFLKRAVEDDPALHVVSILRTTQNKLYRQGVDNSTQLAEGFPSQAEELFSFQGIILGSVETGFFTANQQELIRLFADRRGGGVLFLGGRSALADGGYNLKPFSELLPVTLPKSKNTFRRDMAEATLTEAGKRSLICRIEDDPQQSLEHWKNLPYLPSCQDAGTPKPGALVLAEMNAGGKKLPLLITENYGRGRTAVFATGGSWRWQMQQPVEDMSHEMFWRQLLRWLVAATPQPVLITSNVTELADDGHLQLTAEVRDKSYLPASDAQVEARVDGAGGLSELVSMRPDPLKEGVYTGEWNAPKSGSYLAEVTARRGGEELGSDAFSFRREDGTAENFHRQQNRELLETLASETGGRYFRPQNAHRLGDEIAYSEAGITARETRDLWDMPVIFLLAIALRATEWLLRRKWGFV